MPNQVSTTADSKSGSRSGRRRKNKDGDYKIYCLSTDDPELDMELSEDDRKMHMETFQQCDPIWITTAQILDIKTRVDTDAFVFPKFSGRAFKHLAAMECKIYGNMIVRQCLDEKKNLPKFRHPIWSATMDKATICFTGLPTDVRKEKSTLIEYMFGFVSPNLNTSVNFIVAETCDPESAKYREATRLKVPVVSVKWIDDAWNTATQHNALRFSDGEVVKDYKLPIFYGCELSVSGYGREERAHMAHLIEINGGVFKGDMNKHTCTHLITDKNSGEKFKKAMDWGKKVTTHRWLEKSVQLGYRLREKEFHPSIRCSTPNTSKEGHMLEISHPNISSLGPPPPKISFDEPSINLNMTQNTSRSKVNNTYASSIKNLASQRSNTNATTISLARNTLSRPPTATSHHATTIRSTTTTASREATPTPTSTAQVTINTSSASRTSDRVLTTTTTTTASDKDPIEELNVSMMTYAEDLMEGMRLLLVGFTPEQLARYKRLVNKIGATLVTQFDSMATHAIVGPVRLPLDMQKKLRDLASSTNVAVVTPSWLVESVKARKIAAVEDYPHHLNMTDTRIRSIDKENTPVAMSKTKTPDNRLIRHSSQTFYGERASPAPREIEPGPEVQPLMQTEEADSFLDDNLYTSEPAPHVEPTASVSNVGDQEPHYLRVSASAPLDKRVQSLRESTRVSRRSSSLGGAFDMNVNCSLSVYVQGQRPFKMNLNLDGANQAIDKIPSPTESSDSMSASAIGRALEMAVKKTGRGLNSLEEAFQPDRRVELAREDQMDEPGPSTSQEEIRRTSAEFDDLFGKVRQQLQQAKNKQLELINKRGTSVTESHIASVSSRLNSIVSQRPSTSPISDANNDHSILGHSSVTAIAIEDPNAGSRVRWEDHQLSTQDLRKAAQAKPTSIMDTASLSVNGTDPDSHQETSIPLLKFSPTVPQQTIDAPPVQVFTNENQAEVVFVEKRAPPTPAAAISKMEAPKSLRAFSNRIEVPAADDAMVPSTSHVQEKDTSGIDSDKRSYVAVSMVPTTSKATNRSIHPIPSSPPRRTPPPRTVSEAQTGSPRKRRADLTITTSPRAKRRAADEQQMERNVHPQTMPTEEATSSRATKSAMPRRETSSHVKTVLPKLILTSSAKTARSISHSTVSRSHRTLQEVTSMMKIFAFTNFNSESPAFQRISHVIESLGGEVIAQANGLPIESTHLVYDKLVLNEKVITAMASGKWLVPPDYIHESENAGKWLDEEDYEAGSSWIIAKLRDPKSIAIAKAGTRWRLELKNNIRKYPNGAFSNWNVLLYTSTKRPDRDKTPQFIRILQHGGGNVVHRDMIQGAVDYGEYTHALVELSASCWNDEELTLLGRNRVKCYDLKYLQTYMIQEKIDERECLLEEYRKRFYR